MNKAYPDVSEIEVDGAMMYEAAIVIVNERNKVIDVQERGAYVNIGAAKEAAIAAAASYNKTQQASASVTPATAAAFAARAENTETEQDAPKPVKSVKLTPAQRKLYQDMVRRREVNAPSMFATESYNRRTVAALVNKGLAVYIRRNPKDSFGFTQHTEFSALFALPFGPVHQAGMPDEFNFPEVR